MNLLALYDNAVQKQQIDDDKQQRDILLRLQQLQDDLAKEKKITLWPWKKTKPRGIYIHGPVGAGKTYLMDLFYDNLALKDKARFHFHYFMQQVDKRLRALQGTRDPLQKIAADIRKTTKILCFDEFMVNDVAYAMILGELLQELFRRGIILVATSNTPPDRLYWNGVQRQRFLPAIAAVKAHCDVVCLGEQRDYRLGRTPELATFLCPLNAQSQQKMEEQFRQLSTHFENSGSVRIQNRDIPFVMRAERLIWFQFRVICNLPRSQLDYLEIADKFSTIFVSEIPQLTEKDTLFAILLIHFIDVMYDRGVRLILSAAVPLLELYQCGEMAQPFKRTLSRLQEMQSIDYLQRHRYRQQPDLSQL